MTSDFDELASAHLDGQTSPEERTRVEADPELQARVDEFRALSESLDVDVPPRDQFLKRRQIGAALDAFEALDVAPAAADGRTSEPAVDPAPVDLAGRRGRRDRPAPGRNGLPPWLSVAAVLLLIAGGVGLLTQLGGSGDDDSAETASATATEASGDGEDAGAFDVSGDDTSAAETTAVAAAEVAEADAADEGGDEEAEESSEASADDSGEEDVAARSDALTSTTPGGLFPEEQIEAARVPFATVPSDEELLTLAEGVQFDPELASCAEQLAEETGFEAIFFVPVSVDGVAGEALFSFEGSDLAVALVDADCEPFG